MRQVKILIYDGVEVLDFAGPFEVFAVTGQLNDPAPFEVTLVAEELRPYVAVNGLKVLPNEVLSDVEYADIVVIPGGTGSKNEMRNPEILSWISNMLDNAEIMLTVCSGARFLAVLGALDNLSVVTHHQVYEHIAELAPAAILDKESRFVDNGQIITTGGISAGIDGAFHVVQRLLGEQTTLKTMQYMEYKAGY